MSLSLIVENFSKTKFYFIAFFVARKENMNPYVPSLDRQDSLRKFEKLRANISKIGAYKQNVLPKIVFLFTVNQRSYYRQIVRLIKTLYDDHHYYYIHIDQVNF